jgi:hypothetical protein
MEAALWERWDTLRYLGPLGFLTSSCEGRAANSPRDLVAGGLDDCVPVRSRLVRVVTLPLRRRLPYPTLRPSYSLLDRWIRRTVGRAVLATLEVNQGDRTRLGFWAR